MSILRPLESFIGMFQCLLGVLVSGLMISFPMVRGGGAVCVCGEFMEIGSSLVRVIWHCFSLSSAQSTKSELLALGHLGIRGHEAQHLLLQLRIHLVRDRYNRGKQRAEFQILHVLVQHGKNADLQ
jgi:hypothetical protein